MHVNVLLYMKYSTASTSCGRLARSTIPIRELSLGVLLIRALSVRDPKPNVQMLWRKLMFLTPMLYKIPVTRRAEKQLRGQLACQNVLDVYYREKAPKEGDW